MFLHEAESGFFASRDPFASLPNDAMIDELDGCPGLLTEDPAFEIDAFFFINLRHVAFYGRWVERKRIVSEG